MGDNVLLFWEQKDYALGCKFDRVLASVLPFDYGVSNSQLIALSQS
jgi:hypothetical protein